ncbi:MAG: UvrD-helicase domain-containing protein, partial [Spirochaetota bacterium]
MDSAPLRANLSIEASAGTGKTYTLEQIVCRLVERYGLNIKQILLVTYTEKAAEELRQRIRRRLSLRLRETSETAMQSNILQALNQFSEANISTIHSFFRRCLEQYSLETGQKGISELETNESPVRELLLEELQ